MDVTDMAKEAGFRYPTAITAALWHNITSIPERFASLQDTRGRLWSNACYAPERKLINKRLIADS